MSNISQQELNGSLYMNVSYQCWTDEQPLQLTKILVLSSISILTLVFNSIILIAILSKNQKVVTRLTLRRPPLTLSLSCNLSRPPNKGCLRLPKRMNFRKSSKMRVGGSKAIWNFFEHSSVLVAAGIPKIKYKSGM